MPIEIYVNIAYSDIYDDFNEVIIADLINDIPSLMAMQLVCHYSAMIHVHEIDTNLQINIMKQWYARFPIAIKTKIESKMAVRGFNFINNISSLLLIEYLLVNHNTDSILENLTPDQEENLFKAYLYCSEQWTSSQAKAANRYADVNIGYMSLVIQLPYAELLEFKDFRVQFLKAVYFFKFCETDELFSNYLKVFLSEKKVPSWHQYLFRLISVYVTAFGKGDTKSLINFPKESSDILDSLKLLCVNVAEFEPAVDFLSLRKAPLYSFAANEILILSLNFFIDKIYHSILFDFAEVLISTGQRYKEKLIDKPPKFFGIFGTDFIEPGLFYKLVKTVFKQKDYMHYTGDELKLKFGGGCPDYLIVDNKKIYVFEFKNAIVSSQAKYSSDIEEIKKEFERKFVQNEAGDAKGIRQLLNFLQDFSGHRYENIVGAAIENYIIYPVLVTTDFAVNLPVVYSMLNQRFVELLKEKKMKSDIQIKKFTILDLDTIIKFQDFFINRKFTLNHVFNDYQAYLSKGRNPIDRSLSFSKYMHDKTFQIPYTAPKMFWDEVGALNLH